MPLLYLNRYMALAFETTLFTLTLIKVLSWLLSIGLHRQSVVVVLARDGAWAYAVIFGTSSRFHAFRLYSTVFRCAFVERHHIQREQEHALYGVAAVSRISAFMYRSQQGKQSFNN